MFHIFPHKMNDKNLNSPHGERGNFYINIEIEFINYKSDWIMLFKALP